MCASLSHGLGTAPFSDGALWPATACIAAVVVMFCMAGCSAQPMNVQREGGRVWIEGIQQGESKRGDPFGQAVALALTSAGHPTDYRPRWATAEWRS